MAARSGFGLAGIVLGLVGVATIYFGMKFLVGGDTVDKAAAATLEGPKITIPRPEGVFRIVVLGGDFGAGAGFAQNESIAGRLQNILARNVTNKTIEVLWKNLQKSWDGPVSSAVAARPNVVICILERDAGDSKTVNNSTPAPRSPEWAAARDALARKLAQSLVNDNDAASPAAPLPPEAKIKDLADLCAKHQIKFVAVAVPSALESDSELRALALDALTNEKQQKRNPAVRFDATTSLVNALRAAGLAVLDMTPGFREGADIRRMDLLDFTNGRFNALAANIVAAQIVTHLVGSGAFK